MLPPKGFFFGELKIMTRTYCVDSELFGVKPWPRQDDMVYLTLGRMKILHNQSHNPRTTAIAQKAKLVAC